MKKGYDIEIENIVIHHIKKEAHKDFTKLKCADKLLPKSEKEKFFIADVKKSFSSPGKTYGIFEEKNKSTIFQNLLIEYNSKNLDFLEFTVELMKFYEKIHYFMVLLIPESVHIFSCFFLEKAYK